MTANAIHYLFTHISALSESCMQLNIMTPQRWLFGVNTTWTEDEITYVYVLKQSG